MLRKRSITGPLLILGLLGSAAAAAAESHPHDHGGSLPSRPDDHAPIGVMGDHLHPAGGFMLSYRFMHMRMDGNRIGTRQVSASSVLASGYMAAPTDMDMDMHMFGLMYAPTDWVTLSAMIPYVEKSMDHISGMGPFETNTDGVGDLRLGSLWRIWENDVHHVHVNFGVGFPTGGIDHEDEVPVPMVGFEKRRLPYPMQIGSGSYFLEPGATYTGECKWLSWGVQALGRIHLNENDNDYTVGDRGDFTGWVAVPVLPWVSISARAAGSVWADYEGADPALNPMAIPTADPELRGGEQVDLAPGLNFVVPLGPLGEHRVAIEALLPVYRSLDGPQLETDWSVVVGWQFAF